MLGCISFEIDLVLIYPINPVAVVAVQGLKCIESRVGAPFFSLHVSHLGHVIFDCGALARSDKRESERVREREIERGRERDRERERGIER